MAHLIGVMMYLKYCENIVEEDISQGPPCADIIRLKRYLTNVPNECLDLQVECASPHKMFLNNAGFWLAKIWHGPF